MRYLALHKKEQPITIGAVAEATGMLQHAAVKVVQAMHRRNLLITNRGSKGGISLARKPSEITLTEIACAVDGPPEECAIKFAYAPCNPIIDCPTFDEWESAELQVHTLVAYRDLQSFSDSKSHLGSLV